MDVKYEELFKSWLNFKSGKRKSKEFYEFSYEIEKNLLKLHSELNSKKYQHGIYKKFIVNENKRREISVASIRDRVMHRFLYDRLVKIYDRTFDFDIWSCRKNKGLHQAIDRVKFLLFKHKDCYVLKSDIKKFFDSVDKRKLIEILKQRNPEKNFIWLIEEVVFSYESNKRHGIPIGNLTSQIFANIYLNEFDRFVRVEIQPAAYLRYGDDFLIFISEKSKLEQIFKICCDFLKKELALEINTKSTFFCKPRQKLKFLGMIFKNNSAFLNRRNKRRIKNRISERNLGSYYGLCKKYSDKNWQKKIYWECYIKKIGMKKPSPGNAHGNCCSDCWNCCNSD